MTGSDDFRWRAVREIAQAVNFRAAAARLTELAMERTGAAGGQVVRAGEVLAVRGGECGPAAREFPIAALPATTLRLEGGDEAAAADVGGLCAGVGALLAHFEKFDSRLPQFTALVRPALDVEALEPQLDQPDLARAGGTLLRALAGRIGAAAGALGAVAGRRLELVALHRSKAKDLRQGNALARAVASRSTVRDGDFPILRGAGSFIAAPLVHRDEALGAVAFGWKEEGGCDAARARLVEEAAVLAAPYVRRALLYRESRLMLWGMPRAVTELCDAYADTRAPVLITGETGTGKEMVARYLHRVGRRRDQPIVSLNCAEIAESLAESQLFGHVRGAFSGASADRKGLFEQAHGGTLFLDEIDRLTPALQAKMLRVIEYGEVRPVGSDGPRQVDVKVLAATNKDLHAAATEGRFLPDLHMRLNVCEITLPPLRMNRDVVARVARALVADLGERHGRPARDLTPTAQKAVAEYDYPGNYRELRNILEAAVLACPHPLVDADDLAGRLPAKSPLDYRASKSEFERNYLNAVMQQAAGDAVVAARLSGVPRSTFYYLLKKYGIDPEAFRAGCPAG